MSPLEQPANRPFGAKPRVIRAKRLNGPGAAVAWFKKLESWMGGKEPLLKLRC